MFCRFGAGPGFRKPRRKCPGLDVDETGINEPPVNLMVGFAGTVPSRFAGTVPATYLTSRYSFVHALVGRSQDSPRMPTPGTNV